MKRVMMLAAVCLLFTVASCGSKEEEKEKSIKYVVTSVLNLDTLNARDYVCQIHSISHIELRALEKGYLDKIYVDEGQFVKKGQLMFQIMPQIYDAETQKAQAEVNYAEREYLNTKSLSDGNIVSKNELALAKAKLDKAKAELSLAQVHLSFTKIKAPFDGYVGKFHAQLGSLLDEGELLSTLSDNSQMWVYFNVPEAAYLDYKMNAANDSVTHVTLMMANNQAFPTKGLVETIEADFNNETGNIAFRATFQNPDKLLRHGETGNIRMTIPLVNALVIPQQATFEVMDKKFVFIVDKQNHVHMRQITIGSEMEDLFVVTEGLKKGDRILLEGIRKVRDKDKIAYSYKNPKEVLAHLKMYAE